MSKLFTKKNILALVLIIAIYVGLVVCDQMGIFTRQARALLVPIGINIMLAVSLNLMVGFLGELSCRVYVCRCLCRVYVHHSCEFAGLD
jgi:branched-chain amino acid transport system permease protein